MWHKLNPLYMLVIGMGLTAFRERAKLTKRSKQLKTA